MHIANGESLEIIGMEGQPGTDMLPPGVMSVVAVKPLFRSEERLSGADLDMEMLDGFVIWHRCV